MLLRRNQGIMLAADAVLTVGCYYLAFLIRFEFSIPDEYLGVFLRSWPWVLLARITGFGLFGLYRGVWRYTSLTDLINLCKALVVSSLVIVAGVLMVSGFLGYPRSVYIMEPLLTFIMVGGLRIGIRLYFTRDAGRGFWFNLGPRIRPGDRRLLIVGAGDEAEMVLREIKANQSLKLYPVGLLDDGMSRQGGMIHGVPVLGPVENLLNLPTEFDEVLIAMPMARGEDIRRVVALCEAVDKPFRTLPAMGEVIGGRVGLKAVREVTVEDMLGREELHLDEEQIADYLRSKRVLVTGAGGSIGSELVLQIGRFNPEALALVELSEFNLFSVEMECRQRFTDLKIVPYLADIRDMHTLMRAFEDFKPQAVFHAAAYKHVPMQEKFPWEAVNNNILGTMNVVQAATEIQVERFVLVSTDKAVRPTSVMGATKRVAEMYLECVSCLNGSRFMAVRFGNVVGSSGSAIPFFKEQIARGGPVTVTHPEMIRYFMTVREAAQLILQAGSLGQGTEIFILDMGRPIKILDLVRDMIRLSGFEPEKDIPIQFIGLRPGEKLYEELITVGEGIVATKHKKIMVLKGDTCDFDWITAEIENLLEAANRFDAEAIKAGLKKIVPEYENGDHSGNHTDKESR